MISVIDQSGITLATGFANILAAAIWCNARGYAHPLLEHHRYHRKGVVAFACPVARVRR